MKLLIILDLVMSLLDRLGRSVKGLVDFVAELKKNIQFKIIMFKKLTAGKKQHKNKNSNTEVSKAGQGK